MNSQLSATSRIQIRNRMVKLAGENIRKYPQSTCPVSATNRKIGAIILTLSSKRDNDFDNSDCFDGYTSSPIVITAPSDNHPIIIRRNGENIRPTLRIYRRTFAIYRYSRVALTPTSDSLSAFVKSSRSNNSFGSCRQCSALKISWGKSLAKWGSEKFQCQNHFATTSRLPSLVRAPVIPVQ